MAVPIGRFVGNWRVNRVDKISEASGVALGDTIEILETASDRANVIINGNAFEAELREEGLCSDMVHPEQGPMALQISVYQQFEPGHTFYFRTLYGTAIKKDPDNVGVWGAEEDEPPPEGG